MTRKIRKIRERSPRYAAVEAICAAEPLFRAHVLDLQDSKTLSSPRGRDNHHDHYVSDSTIARCSESVIHPVNAAPWHR